MYIERVLILQRKIVLLLLYKNGENSEHCTIRGWVCDFQINRLEFSLISAIFIKTALLKIQLRRSVSVFLLQMYFQAGNSQN